MEPASIKNSYCPTDVVPERCGRTETECRKNIFYIALLVSFKKKPGEAGFEKLRRLHPSQGRDSGKTHAAKVKVG